MSPDDSSQFSLGFASVHMKLKLSDENYVALHWTHFTLSVTPSCSKCDGISKFNVGPLMANTAYFFSPSCIKYHSNLQVMAVSRASNEGSQRFHNHGEGTILNRCKYRWKWGTSTQRSFPNPRLKLLGFTFHNNSTIACAHSSLCLAAGGRMKSYDLQNKLCQGKYEEKNLPIEFVCINLHIGVGLWSIVCVLNIL